MFFLSHLHLLAGFPSHSRLPTSEKQADRHAGYAGKSSMSAEERHSFYDGMKSEDGDPVEELLAAGVITQEQADSIQAYLN